jgi:hypothetical protein
VNNGYLIHLEILVILQLDFYTIFKVVHHDIDIGLTSFDKLKLSFVNSFHDFNSCCCKYHQEMAEIKVGFNNMCLANVHHGLQNSTCTCGCMSLCANLATETFRQGIVTCQVMSHTFEGAFDLWEKTLCPKTIGENLFNLDCIRGKCFNCGFHILPFYYKEIDPTNDNLMAWRCFQKVHASETGVGEQKEVVHLVSKLTTP